MNKTCSNYTSMRTRERESQCSSRESEGASEETGETFKRLAGYEGGAMHFFQSKTHTPMVDVAGPKGIHEHVSEVLHAAGARELQLMEPLEQVIIGMGSSSTGMHQPGDVVFHTEPHHWQHFEASHSSAVARVQFSLGTGGAGAGEASMGRLLPLLAALCAILSAAARLRAACLSALLRAAGALGAGVAGGVLHESQSYMHMPEPVMLLKGIQEQLGCARQVVLTVLTLHMLGSLSQTRLVLTGSSCMQKPTATGTGTVGGSFGPHHVQQSSAEQFAWSM